MKAITRGKLNKAPGPDGFSFEYYKTFTPQLLRPLQIIMNGIIDDGMPETWCKSYITLIPKENKNILDMKIID